MDLPSKQKCSNGADSLAGQGSSYQERKPDSAAVNIGPRGQQHQTLDESRQILSNFEEAMNSISPKDKEAYLEAKERAPEVVESESNPMLFIKLCDFDVWAAAFRYCLYWKERKHVFQELFFLPLTLNKGGALAHDDILLVQAGYPCLLPRSESGLQVLWHDRNRCLPSTTRQSRMRALFYMVNKLNADERSVTDGVIFLNVLIQPRLTSIDHGNRAYMTHLGENVFPLKLIMHTLCLLPKTMRGFAPATTSGKRESKKSWIQNVISKAANFPRGPRTQIKYHIEKDESAILKVVQGLGVNASSIPTTMGGTWPFAEVMHWCRAQTLEESGATARLVGDKATSEVLLHASSLDDGCSDSRKRAKMSNVVHSRRKREKKRQELEALKEEKEQLATRNSSLKTEQARLQSLLAQVFKVVRDDPGSGVGAATNLLGETSVAANTMAQKDGETIGLEQRQLQMPTNTVGQKDEAHPDPPSSWDRKLPPSDDVDDHESIETISVYGDSATEGTQLAEIRVQHNNRRIEQSSVPPLGQQQQQQQQQEISFHNFHQPVQNAAPTLTINQQHLLQQLSNMAANATQPAGAAMSPNWGFGGGGNLANPNSLHLPMFGQMNVGVPNGSVVANVAGASPGFIHQTSTNNSSNVNNSNRNEVHSFNQQAAMNFNGVPPAMQFNQPQDPP